VRTELDALRTARDRTILLSDELSSLTGELRSVNEALWEIEDEIRGCERAADFGPKFVELARSVYRDNDRRAAIKKRINVLMGSKIIEEKSYAGTLCESAAVLAIRAMSVHARSAHCGVSSKPQLRPTDCVEISLCADYSADTV
jgi:hypothetical protein